MPIMLSKQPSFQVKRMEYAQQKTASHSENMARSEIPGEETKEIESFSKATRAGEKRVRAPQVRLTNPKHLIANVPKTTYRTRKARHQPEVTLNGNSISPEQQLLGINEASTMHLDANESLRNMATRARLATGLFKR